MKEHNYAFQNADERPRLQSRTQNIGFVISISAFILKLMVKIMAWHFLTFTSPSSKLELSPVLRSRRANAHLLVRFNAWASQRLLNWNPILKLTIVLIWKTPTWLKFGKTCNRAVENLPERKLWVWAANDALSHSPNFPARVFIWVVRGAMHSRKKERSALWLNAMHSGKKCG